MFDGFLMGDINILNDLGFDFYSMLAPFWEPSWRHVGHQDAPGTRPGRPGRPTRQPKRSQDLSLIHI